MEQLTPTIGTVSRQILFNFTRKEGTDGRSYWDLRQDVEWQHHLILESLGNHMPSPQAYESAFRVLMEIFVATNPDEAEEFLAELETTPESAELTAWLAADPGHVEYLTEALKNTEVASGETALTTAYNIYLQTIGSNLIEAIKTYITSEEVVVAAVN